ncbi:MAG: phosphoadenosine phosphosulfate reductase family protein, partial [Campylobacterota bacterium]|nr:phosphoadenosine phosphosulfate reductase family protein [Campylobacterota bacterium]
MNLEYRQFHIKEMLLWSLDKKVEHALKRIKEFYEFKEGKVYVGFSCGKDSVVLLHLVRSLFPNVVAVFSDTTNEYTEILKFSKTVENLIIVKPKMTFNQVVKEYGFPLVSKKVSMMIARLKENSPHTKKTRDLYLTGITSKGTPAPSYKLPLKWYPLIDAKFDLTNKCCDILKKEPLKRYAKESGNSPIIGTLIEESQFRKNSWLGY